MQKYCDKNKNKCLYNEIKAHKIIYKKSQSSKIKFIIVFSNIICTRKII